MRTIQLKAWEVILIILALILFILSSLIYLSNFPLYKYIFHILEDDKILQIGTIIQQTGTVKRQYSGELSYQIIPIGSPLFQKDILVTSNNSTSILHFNDESTVELGPNTMVRLIFLNEFFLGGIHRLGHIDFVTGKITSTSKKNFFSIIGAQQTVSIPPYTQQTISTEVHLGQSTLHLSKSIPIDPITALPILPELTPEAQISSTPSVSSSPTPSFTPSPLPKQAPIFSPIPSPLSSASPEPLPSSSVSQSPSALAPSPTPSHSPLIPLNPVSLTTPVAEKQFLTAVARIIFSWKKEPLLIQYEIEISKNSDFTNIMQKKIVTANFYLLQAPQDGDYWWRVTGIALHRTAPPSAIRHFTIGSTQARKTTQ